jgi:hypothetical protein
MRASPAAATAATTRAPSAAAPTAAFAHGASLVHHQRAAQEILAVAGLHGSICFFIISKLREPESARFAGELVANDLHRIRLKPGLGEPVLQLCLTRLVWKVAYKQFFQGSSFWPISKAGLRTVGTPILTCIHPPPYHSPIVE